MIAACKAETKNKEAWDKVRDRSAVTTTPVKGSPELGNQIARLMAALIRAGQPWQCSKYPHTQRPWERMDRQEHSRSPNSYNGQTGLGQTTSSHSASVGHGMRTTTTGGQGQNAQGSKDSKGSTSNRKDTSSLQCFRCQGWGHMAQECATPTDFKPVWWEPRGCSQTPHQHQSQQPTVGPQHSLPDPKPKPTIPKVVGFGGML